MSREKCNIAPYLITLCSLLILACGQSASAPSPLLIPHSPFATFRDVPGVTAEEIAAIESLKAQRTSFMFGAEPDTTEAVVDENGKLGGFSGLLCGWLSDFFGIPFIPEIYSFAKIIEGLRTFEIDFTASLSATEERLRIYSMTDSIAFRSARIYHIADSRPLPEIERERPVRYLLLEGAAVNISVLSTLVPGTYEIIYISSNALAYGLLKDGTADAYISLSHVEGIFDPYGDVVTSDFYPLIFQPISLTIQNPVLRPVISVVQKIMQSDGQAYLASLYAKGYQDYMKHKLSMMLSAEEHEYIISHPVVPIVAIYDNFPVCFYNTREGEWQGIFFDIFDEITAITGLSFNLINENNADWPVIYEMARSGEASLIADMTRTPEREAYFIWPEMGLQPDYFALLSRSDYRDITINEIHNTRVGLPRSTVYASTFKQWFPNHENYVEYENMDGAIAALGRGEVDLVMSTQRRLMFITHFLELPGYKTNIVFDQPIQTISGVNKKEEALSSIIEKALKIIDTRGISDQWMRKTYDYRAKVAEGRLPLLIGVSALFLVVLSLMLVIFFRNRGEGKRLAGLVAERTASLTAILDGTPDLIFHKDLESRFTECNKALEGFFNVTKESIIGKQDTEALGWSPEVAEVHLAWDKKVFSEKHMVVVEEIAASAVGEKRIFETIRTPIIQDGETTGLVCIARDITRRKAAEDEAKIASEAKSRFIATMSHELRTPMNSIIGFSELAMNDRLEDETRDYLSKIMINSEWLLQIINDILDISKIESGKMEMEHIPFDLHELFIACRTIITPKADEKGVILYFYAEPSIGKKLHGDPLRLRQVLLNLLSNAVKFTNKGGIIKISAAVKAEAEDSISIGFEVKDSGIGMTVEQIAKISQPFMQADTTTTRKYGGTGLGLAISKNIIELMGGKLRVESTPGVGSKFSFEITFDTAEPEEAADMAFIENPTERPRFEGEILLCEDNQMNQQVLCEHLDRVGIKVDVAENGREGYNMVKRRLNKGEKPYGLIFMDIHMPIMDGIEASTLINELNTGSPIVAMTANVMSHDRELYRKCGMNDCVGKPFKVQELWACLLKYFTPVKWAREKDAESRQYNDKLQFLLMATFVKDNRNRYGEISAAIDSGDIKLANRLAHTLKGNAGQLGKVRLQKAAELVEHLLKDGKNLVTAEHLAVLEAELAAALDELAPLVKEAALPPTSQAEPLDAEKAHEVLVELKPLLESGNAECLKYIDKLRGISGTDEPLVRKLIQQMEDLDFEDALETLSEVMGN